MGSLFARGRMFYAKIQGVDGAWKQVRTGFSIDQRELAEAWVVEREREVALVKAGTPVVGMPETSVSKYADRWIEQRKSLGLDWRKDRGHLDNYILPRIGEMGIGEVRTNHIATMIIAIRTSPMVGGSGTAEERPGQRTVYNIYATCCSMFRDAVAIHGLIEVSPCQLTGVQLGPKTDKDPEWRVTAVFTHDEVEAIISTPKVPLDRRVCYALEMLAGLRPGEVASLRWRHFDPTRKPLGELLIVKSYSTKNDRVKGTKTEAIRHVPVHPTLGAILAEWKLSGWSHLMDGVIPTPNDLIVPMPLADAAARTTRAGTELHRTDYYSRRRWTDEDEPALGFRHRRHYDMRATFITLALEDGADPEIIEKRVTHTKKGRGAFDGYVRASAPQWERACAEVAKLRVSRVVDREQQVVAIASGDDLGAALVQAAEPLVTAEDLLLRRRGSNGRRGEVDGRPVQDVPALRVVGSEPSATDADHLHQDDGASTYATGCDLGLALMRAAAEPDE